MLSNKLTTGLDNVVLSIDNLSEDQFPSFWYQPTIDGTRWNELYPYQLLVVTAEGKNGKLTYKKNPKWVFTLPITPERAQISMPFAITTEVTQGGIIEQHNASPLRFIQLQGTTGVLPLKGSGEPLKAFNPAEGIFAGTLQTVNSLGNAVQSALSNVTGQSNVRANIVKDQELTPDSNRVKSSGYYQFLMLRNFLENYGEYKKTEAGKTARLALAMWKDESVYLVTPKTFDMIRQVPSVYEYKYQLSFEAYKRISLEQSEYSNGNFLPIVRNPNAFARLLKTIEDSRLALQKSKEVLYAVVADIGNAIYEPLRQVTSFAKGILGVGITTQDLPIQIIQQAKGAIIELIATQNTFNSFTSGVIAKHAELADQITQIKALGAALGKSQTLSGDLPASLTSALNSDAINSIFTNPNDYPEIFSSIRVGDLNLNPSTVKAIVADQEAIQNLTRLDFERLRDQFQMTMTNFSTAVGAGNPTYDRLYGRTISFVDHTPNLNDYHVMFSLNNIILELNRLAASGEINRFQMKPIEYVAGLAKKSGIDFQIPLSKRVVPFPYGMTLEKLATLYLGNPDRWIEIVTLNGLQEPYIDEIGFSLPFLANGKKNDLVVSESTHFYLNQAITLQSDTVLFEKRYITSIRTVGKGQVILTVDGPSDLNKYKVSDHAYLHAFLPNTINSQMLIYLPSQEPTNFPNYQTKSIPSIKHFEDILQVGGVDLLLTNQLDLALTPDGDTIYSVGLTNVIQRAKVALSIPQGTLPRHPTYGFGIPPGIPISNLQIKDIYKAVATTFENDPDYSGVKSIAIQQKGPVAQLGVELETSYLNQNIPITFDLLHPSS